MVLASKNWVQVYNWFPIALKYIYQYTCRFSHLVTCAHVQAVQNRSRQQLRMIPVLDHEYNKGLNKNNNTAISDSVRRS